VESVAKNPKKKGVKDVAKRGKEDIKIIGRCNDERRRVGRKSLFSRRARLGFPTM